MALKKIIYYCLTITFCVLLMSANAFARTDNQIEVYKLGNQSVTIKWTPYEPGSNTLQKYSIGYRIHGAAAYTYIDIDSSFQSPNYNSELDEFSKKVSNLAEGTIYDIKIDTYIEESVDPIVYYTDIKVLTKMVIDKTVTSIIDPYNDDSIGHLDFSFIAPNEEVLGTSSSVDMLNIDGYNLLVSASEGQIYSGGQPYKALYNAISGKYELFKVTSGNVPLTYDTIQFDFDLQDQAGKDLLAFALYKNNQPAVDDFSLASVYYVVVQPIFKAGSGYEDVIVDATARYETIETISTLLPLTVTQISNDLIKLEFEPTSVGSMTYDIYKGRTADSLTKIHTEYDDGSRLNIQYFNKLDLPGEGDVYYFKVVVSNGVTSQVVSVTITLNPNIAPALENIQVDRIITDKVNGYSDIIISWDKPENEDTNRADLLYRVYLNTDAENQVYDNDVVYDNEANILYDINGKIVLNAKQDINNNLILFNGLPVVFERISEIAVSGLSDPNTIYSGNSPIDNFLATGNNYYRISRNSQQVTRVIYKISGQDFLTNLDVPLYGGVPHTIYSSQLEGELPTDYKTSLELNTTYFIKMDSYNQAISEDSGYSLTASFTTPTELVETVPAPTNLEAVSIDTNSIGIAWDKINDALYNEAYVTYEVYISEDGSYSDASFYKIKNPTITVIDDKEYLLVDNYTLEDDIPKTIEPNKVYLFKVRAVWTTADDMDNVIDVYSKLSSILPVTTKREIISDPDMTAPSAPIDFQVTSVTSRVASFQWTKVDDFSTYRIIKTSTPPGDLIPIEVVIAGVTEGFVLDGNTYTYADPALSANTLYYFSIRSEIPVNALDEFGNPIQLISSSSWITVPVTTILVESPTELTLVSRNEDGHAVTISWKGKASLDYEVALKSEAETNYTLAESIVGDSEDASTKVHELIIDNLNSNMKYYIKVRAKDSSTGMYSKYTGPIQVRTQFNQEDYDEQIEDEEKAEIITDAANDWMKSPIEEIGGDNSKTEIWIKPEQAVDIATNASGAYYTVSLNDSDYKKNKVAYIPLDLINGLNQANKIIELKTNRGSFYFKPWMFNGENLSDMINLSSVESRMVKIQINDLSDTESLAVIPRGDFAASSASELSIDLVGYDKTGAQISQLMADAMEDIISSETELAGSIPESALSLLLSDRIKSEMKSIVDGAYICKTEIPLSNNKIRITYSYTTDPSGNSGRYVAYFSDGTSSQELEGQIIADGKMQFETTKPGKFIVIGKRGASDITGHAAQESIELLIARYGFSKELTGGYFFPDRACTRSNAINFIIDVLNPIGSEFESLTSLEKAKKLGIVANFPIWDLTSILTRQELAYLVSMGYQNLSGIDIETLIPAKDIYISDEGSISKQYIKSVYTVLDNNIMGYVSNDLFYPGKSVTRAEVAVALVNMLENVMGSY